MTSGEQKRYGQTEEKEKGKEKERERERGLGCSVKDTEMGISCSQSTE